MGKKPGEPGEFLRELMHEIIGRDKIEAADTADKKKALLEELDPRGAGGGFIGIEAVIICVCGHPAVFRCSPRMPTQAEEEIIRKDPGMTVLDATSTGGPIDPNSETACAMNVGYRHGRCKKCNRQWLAHWQMEAATVSAKAEVPWEGKDEGRAFSLSSEAVDTETIH